MCVYSMIAEHYQAKWGQPPYISYPGYNPHTYIITQTPSIVITAEQWNEYQELKRKAIEYDARTNQPDCVKPELEEWEARMKAYLIELGVIKGE